jgi:dihydrofolate reductase
VLVSCFRVEWEVIAEALLSLDGVMQAPGGPEEDPTGGFKFGGWVVPYVDEVFGQAVDRMFGQPFDLLLGRKTYEIFAAHWPYAEGGADEAVQQRQKVRRDALDHGADVGGFGRAA